MSDVGLRFLHASDFRLGMPMRGIRYVPDEWKERLINAPYDAVTKVVETALNESVDFVAFTGDLIDPKGSSPYAINFLLEQFQTLDEAEIPVYWLGGRFDRPSRWPKSISFPSNVHLLASDEIETITATTQGNSKYSIVGRSFDGRNLTNTAAFAGIGDEDETLIALCYGDIEVDDVELDEIAYWACGGLEEKTHLEHSIVELFYPGTPQPRCAAQKSGGCALVSVSHENVTVLSEVQLAPLNWTYMTVDVDLEETDNQVSDRCHDLIDNSSAVKSSGCSLVVIQLRVKHGHKWLGPRRGEFEEFASTLAAEVLNRHNSMMVADVVIDSPMDSISQPRDGTGVIADFQEMTQQMWADGWGEISVSDRLPSGMPLDMQLIREDIDGMHSVHMAANYATRLLESHASRKNDREDAA